MTGEVITSRKGIADMFGEFYGKLYDDDCDDKMRSEAESNEKKVTEHRLQEMNACKKIPEFTMEEMQAPLIVSNVANQETAMESELKTSKDVTRSRRNGQIFNEVSQQKDCTPETWRKIRIKVIYMNCDVQDAGNYRTICTLPALFKLFSTLYIRLYPRLDQCQPADQGGFRLSHQMDHLMVYRMLEQRCREWVIPLYISTIDFTKAFDRIKHQSL